MLNEEQLQSEVKITGSTALIMLQVVARVANLQNGLKDVELKPVGEARDNLVTALEEATGLNFDRERARQQLELQQRLAASREEQDKEDEDQPEEVSVN